LSNGIQQNVQFQEQHLAFLNSGLFNLCGFISTGVAAFEIDYSNWVEEQNRHTAELRSALQGQTTELELRMLVETGLNNYEHLFRIKALAANSDVFYVTSGVWKTPAERFFLWIGGFRPSEVLKVAGSLNLLTTDHRAASGMQQVLCCLTRWTLLFAGARS